MEQPVTKRIVPAVKRRNENPIGFHSFATLCLSNTMLLLSFVILQIGETLNSGFYFAARV